MPDNVLSDEQESNNDSRADLIANDGLKKSDLETVNDNGSAAIEFVGKQNGQISSSSTAAVGGKSNRIQPLDKLTQKATQNPTDSPYDVPSVLGPLPPIKGQGFEKSIEHKSTISLKNDKSASSLKDKQFETYHSSENEDSSEEDKWEPLRRKKEQQRIEDEEKGIRKQQTERFQGLDQNDPKLQYMQSFAKYIDIPSAEIRSCYFFKKDPTYSFALVNYVLPKNLTTEGLNMISHDLDQTKPQHINFLKSVDWADKQLCIKLVSQGESSIDDDKIPQICLTTNKKPVYDAIFKSSNDSKYVAIFYKMQLESHLKVFKIDENKSTFESLQQLFKDIGEDKPLFSYKGKSKGQLQSIKKMRFGYSCCGRHSRYLVLNSDTDVIVLSLQEDPMTRELKVEHEWTTKKEYKFKEKQRPKDYFEKIYDVRGLHDSNKNQLLCQIACKVKGQRQIQVIDIQKNETQRKSPRILTYHNDDISKLLVMISKDKHFSSIIFANREENYVLETNQNNKKTSIMKLPQLKGKLVRSFNANKDGSFMLVASHDYDSSIEIVHSEYKSFSIQFDMKIEPGLLKIYDMNISLEDKEQGSLKLISSLDGGFNLDQATFNYKVLNSDRQITKEQITNFRFEAVNSFSVKWPYVCFGGFKQQYLWIICAFDHEQVHRVQLPDEPDQILSTYITETNDLFVMTQKGSTYMLQYIDLDAAYDDKDMDEALKRKQQNRKKEISYKVTKLLKYDSKDVGDKPLLNMHIRGSSRKESIDTNQQLIIFLLHDENLYSWNQLYQQKLETHDLNASINIHDHNCFGQATLQHVCKSQSVEFQSEFDGSFLIQRDIITKCPTSGKDEVSGTEIVKFTVNFSDYDQKVVHKEYINTLRVLQFALDEEQQKILVFNQSKTTVQGKTLFFVKFIDLIEEKVIMQTEIHDEQLLGRLRSGLYTYIDGHCYFANHVVKIRFDILESKLRSQEYTELQLFDEYRDIFKLRPGERIKSMSPIKSISSHKFVYLISNVKEMGPIKIMIVPYLHEKRIYLNRLKQNTDYFYTSIQTDPKQVTYTTDMVDSHDSSIHQKKMDIENRRFIVCVNLSESKYYCYNQRGILTFRYVFEREVKNHGDIVAVSPNGLNFMFMKTNDTNTDLILTVYTITEVNFVKIKHFHLYELLQTQIQKLINSNHSKLKEKRRVIGQSMNEAVYQNNDWIKDCPNVDFMFKINDNYDICVRMTQKDHSHEEHEEQQQKEQEKFVVSRKKSVNAKSVRQSLSRGVSKITDFLTIEGDTANKDIHYDQFYFFVGGKILVPRIKKKNDKRELPKKIWNTIYNTVTGEIVKPDSWFLYFTQDKQSRLMNANEDLIINQPVANHLADNFCLNNFNIMFWQKDRIWCIDYKKPGPEQTELNFKVPKDSEAHIKEVRSGSHPKIVTILLKQSHNQDCVITWNIEQNKEKEAFDVTGTYEILWDHHGMPYIVQEERCFFTPQRVTMKCFEDVINLDHQIKRSSNYPDIGTNTGHRFDGDYHNWLVMNGFLCLSFSYMTFVINERVMNDQSGNNLFDITPFNYVFNKRTPFMDKDNKLMRDHELLHQILEQMFNFDQDYLCQLHYTCKVVRLCNRCKILPSEQKKGELQKSETLSALSTAIAGDNSKIVDTVLEFIGRTPMVNTSKFYQNYIEDLVDLPMFQLYLEKLPLKSYSIDHMQTLNFKYILSDQLAQINENVLFVKESNCIYLDKSFFKETKLSFVNRMMLTLTQSEKLKEKCYPVKIYAVPVEWIMTDKRENGFKFLQELLTSKNLQIFEIPSVIILVEYLYIRFSVLNKILMIFNFLQLFFFVCSVSTNEISRTQIKTEIDQDKCLNAILLQKDDICKESIMLVQDKEFWGTMAIIFGWLNLLLTIFNGLLNFAEYYGMGIRALLRIRLQWTVLELLVIVLNSWLAYLQVLNENIKYQRRLSSIITLIIIVKSIYFLKVFKTLASIIDTIQEIIIGVKDFVVILIIFIFAFSLSFYLLGQNEVQFDEISDPDNNLPTYTTFSGSLWNTWQTCIGNMETDHFFQGNAGEKNFIVWLYFAKTSILLIVMLNMLIAIMGDIFNSNNAIRNKTQLRDHLELVVYKWTFKELVFNWYNIKTSQIKYIISAFNSDVENQSDLGHIREYLLDLKNDVTLSQVKQYHSTAKNAKLINQQIQQTNNLREELDHMKSQQANDMRSIQSEFADIKAVLAQLAKKN